MGNNRIRLGAKEGRPNITVPISRMQPLHFHLSPERRVAFQTTSGRHGRQIEGVVADTAYKSLCFFLHFVAQGDILDCFRTHVSGCTCQGYLQRRRRHVSPQTKLVMQKQAGVERQRGV